MNSVLLIIKLAIPFAALLGIGMFFVYKLKMPCAFSFALACGGIVFALFIGGYVNLLPQAVLVLYAFGIGCLTYFFSGIIRKKFEASFVIAPALYAFIAACLFCVLALRNFEFATHDEYSHWGIMIKEMATSNSFPGKGSIIRFIDYPPATALFMYFFIYSTGFSQSIAYIAQGIFAMAPLMVFFKYSSFKKPISLLAPAIISVVLMLSFEATLQYLLVDYLVGLYAIAITVAVLTLHERISKSPISACLAIMPLIISASLIKTSALFYGLFACVIICIIILRSKKNGGLRLTPAVTAKLSVILSSPLWVWYLYQKNAEQLFGIEKYKNTQFTLVPENLINNFTQRPASFRAAVLKDSFIAFFTEKASLCALAALVLCTIVIAVNIKRGKGRPRLLTSLTLCAGAGYLIYYIGYVFALLFLFPYEELVAFNTTTIAISRYISAASGACLGLCLFGLLDLVCSVPALSAIKKSALGIAAALLFIPFARVPAEKRSVYSEEAEAQIREVEAFAANHRFAREDRLLFYNGEYDDNDINCGYNNYTYTNSFLNNNIAAFSNTHLEGGPYEYTDYKLKHYFLNSDYLVAINSSPQLFDILNAADIDYDERGGVIYKIEVTDNGSLLLARVN